MLNIVFICSEYPPSKSGGIGVFTKKIAEGLVDTGNNVFVIGCYSDIKKKVEEVVCGVNIIRLPQKKGKPGLVFNRLNIYKSIKKISSSTPIDIIECPDFEGAIAYLPQLAKKNVTRLHGSHTYFSSERDTKPSLTIQYLEKKQLKSASKIVSVSGYTANKTQQLFGLSNEPVIIYNSVDVDKLQLNAKSNYSTQKRVIYFGTLAEKKGIYPLSQAWRQFSKDNPDWLLTVVGKDAMENERSNKDKMIYLLAEAKDTVRFVEHMENEELICSLKEYDFAILPSFSEAFALAPLEAMAVGLPVIISNMSSGPELINHGVDGWLCDPQRPETLVEMLNQAASSESVRQKVAEIALEKIKTKFNFQSFMENNISFYKNLVSN